MRGYASNDLASLQASRARSEDHEGAVERVGSIAACGAPQSREVGGDIETYKMLIYTITCILLVQPMKI